MAKFKCTFLSTLTLLIVNGCTQQPAHIEYKGSQFFGREHEVALDSGAHETYSPDSERYKPGFTHPVAPAAVPAVTIAELPPPTSAPAALQSPTTTAENKSQFIWPVSGGKIVSHFGLKPDGKTNDGINIAVPEGEPVYAAAAGKVVFAGNQLKDYGNMVILRHESGWMSAYAHLRDIAVKKGSLIKQNDRIGTVGMTGGVKTPQLHFALREGKKSVDPEHYLPNTAMMN